MEDQYGEPIVMGLVDEDELPPLLDPLDDAGLPVQRRRLLRMAAPALVEALSALDTTDRAAPPLPLLLGAAGKGPAGQPNAVDVSFLEQLAMQADRPLDLQHSRVLPQGRASGLLALQQALGMLARGEAPCVLVGGIDSYLDSRLVEALDAEGRLRTGEVQDGFVPGEAAAFVVVARPGAGARANLTPLTRVLGMAFAHEPGHLYSDQPYLGEGLSQAFTALFAATPQTGRVRTLYAGLNGESFWAKELGVALLRNGARFEEPVRTEHPADAIGDVGAALGPVMLGLAALGLRGGYRPGPALVYCGSDREERAAALLGA